MGKISELLNTVIEAEGNFSMKIVKNNAGGEKGIDLAFASAKKMKKNKLGFLSLPDDHIAITGDTKLKGVDSIEDLKVGMKVKGKFKKTARGNLATELEV